MPPESLLAAKILAWYDRHARKLPWRAPPGASPDPYAVWLSEVMLQQTTVAAVGPYFRRFLARWPNVAALAAAPDDEVMREWAGLGYYSRARNLVACARAVAARDGAFPDTEDSLRGLPGVGPYTAAAIAAIAFDRRAVVIDGNVERVVARLYAIETPLPAAKSEIRSRADALTPRRRAGDFAQAMMDLGATICTPKRPACARCPLSDGCAAKEIVPEGYPRRAPKREPPERSGAIFVATRADGAVLVRTRPPRGLLGGMTEFPGSEWSVSFDARSARGAAPLALAWREATGEVAHVFTHFSLRLAVYLADAQADCAAPDGCRWIAADRLHIEALPTLMRKVAALAGVDARRRK